MHDIPNIEVARHKAKAAEHKLEGIKKETITIIDKKKRHNVGIVKIIGHLVINATNLNHMPMKLKIGRKHLTVTLIIKKRKTHVVDAVTIGYQAINVGTVRQYSAESSMEKKRKSMHKKSHLILIPTQNQNEG